MKVRPWVLAATGLLAFATAVWFAGPVLVIGGQAPLASPEVRLLVISAFALQYLAQKVWSAWQARRKNEHVVAALIPAPQGELSAEAEQLRERFSTALEQLRRARLGPRGPWKLGRSYLYQLPWYAIIGAPGSGKTTALLNSGLNFPLEQKLGRGSVRGFGGTRNCDWWFTDRAVLIDTAGRYTTHESDRVADRQAWETFLQLLLASRPRRPLNGVLVAVSVSDLLEFTPDGLRAHARTLRARLDELQSALRVRIPVYVLLTKCDLLPGFVDWFGSMSRAERDQVWGMTFDLRAAERSGRGAAAGFADDFERLVNRLADLLVEKLQAERDLTRRARIFSLPTQLYALRERLGLLVQDAFGWSGSSSSQAPLIRGVYLTSGTQQGTPIDRLLFALGRELGLASQILPANQNTGKSFFLSGVLQDVVLAEYELDGRAPLKQRAQRLLVASTAACVFAAAFALAGLWVSGYTRATQQIARFEDEVARAQTIIDAIPASLGVNPRMLLPALETVRSLRLPRENAHPLTEFAHLGTRARLKLVSASQAAYDRMLLGPFQTQIAKAIDTTLREGAQPEVQYEALKAYRMLSDPAHFDATGFRTFVISYWNSALQPPLNPAERAELAGHLAGLLQAGAVGSGLRVEPSLAQSVQSRLSSQPITQQIALRLEVLLQSEAAPDFTIGSMGTAAAELFAGADGASEPKPVPGRYILRVYTDVVNGQTPKIAAQLASEAGWVLGASRANEAAEAAEVLESYRAAYSRAWALMLDDLRLRRATNNNQAVRQAQTLAKPDGPLPALLGEIVRETPLNLPDGSSGPIVATEADRFRTLAQLVVPDSTGNSPLKSVLRSFAEIQTLRGAHAGGGDPSTQGEVVADRLTRLVAEARTRPEPVRSMLLSLAVLPEGGPAMSARLSGTALSKQVAAKLGLPCIQLVAGNFPFDRRAMRDAPFEDFARLFAPQGGFDGAFKQLLATRVDTSSGDNWRWLGSGSEPPAQELERFRAAARIRDVFFVQGGAHPGLRLTFRPVDMDEDIDRFQLEIDGQTVRYAHGPPEPTTIDWPGARGTARIEVSPAGNGPMPAYSGPWALFRLLDHAAVRDAGTAGHFQVIFDVGGRHATFDVSTDSGANPFRLRELERFECPIPGQ
jgi:type VI secretion system protein ImpL